jgi:hypothetical protein
MTVQSRATLAYLDDAFVVPSLRRTSKFRTALYYASILLESHEWARAGTVSGLLDKEDLLRWASYRRPAFEDARGFIHRHLPDAVHLDQFPDFSLGNQVGEPDYSLYVGLLSAAAGFSDRSSKAFQIWLLDPTRLNEVTLKELESALAMNRCWMGSAHVLSGFLRTIEYISNVSNLVSSNTNKSRSLLSIQRWRLGLQTGHDSITEAFEYCGSFVLKAVQKDADEGIRQQFLFDVQEAAIQWDRLTRGARWSAA